MMLLREIRYVLAVHEHSSFTKAAESLFISQPALSKYIKGLESTLGAKLFEKDDGKLTLTYAGQAYVDAARSIMSTFDKMVQETLLSDKEHRGRLKLGITSSRGSHLLPKVLPIFYKMYPNVEFILFEEHADKLEQLLLDGIVDVIIIKLPLMLPNIEYIHLCEEELLLSVPCDHPCVSKAVWKDEREYPWIDLRHFKDDVFILLKPGQRTRRIVDEILLRAGIAPQKTILTNNIETATRLSSELGITFIPEQYTTDLSTNRAPCFFSIGEPTTTCTFVAGHRKNGYLTPCAKDFLQIVIDYYSAVKKT